jgi:uncharacterized protein YqgC (DUF456 family)
MTMGIEIVLLAAALVASFLLIPFGLPGTFLMVCAGFVFNLLVPGDRVGTATIVGTTALALVAEGIEFWLAARFNRRFGGSRRAGWGAILGGMAGAMVGIPVPIIGSVIGAFGGAFLGALVMEYTHGGDAGASTRVATGALLGRVASVAMKVAIGGVIAVWLLAAAWS